MSGSKQIMSTADLRRGEKVCLSFNTPNIWPRFLRWLHAVNTSTVRTRFLLVFPEDNWEILRNWKRF